MISEQQQTKIQIQNSLAKMSMNEFYPAIVDFWAILGYQSDRQPDEYAFDYQSFIQSYGAGKGIKEEKAKAADWQNLYLLFQITDQEIGHSFQAEMQADIFKPKLKPGLLKSYLFAALELKGDNYSRTALADIARQINRCFAIPLIIAFKYNDKITIAVVDRRRNLKDTQKDVLEKVILIKDIYLSKPHRAHLDILQELSISALAAKYPLNNFDDLHKAWGKTLDLKELNRRFYKELSNWYFWAVENVEFPDGEEKDREKRNSISIIRLLTRMIFVWFMKEKGLIPENLFEIEKINVLIKFEDAQQSSYYKAILQNLFFATLNTEMEKDKAGSRRFRKKITGPKNPDFNDHNLYRYEKLFKEPDTAIADHFGNVPFLNGGLFECLDSEYEEANTMHYVRIDGFSDRNDNTLKVPDELFLKKDEEEIDLNTVYGTKNKHYKVRGLLSLLHSYKFTVAENTPVEEEVALDPELLGRVFENLLAAYNPETKSTARHETGSFYTPREIVDYMVDESLIAHLTKALPAQTDKQKEDNELRLRLLLYYSDDEHLFADKEVDSLINALDSMKAIDPACGSGAFLMGLLLKMVYILHKLDAHNEKWKAQQIANIRAIIRNVQHSIQDTKVREENIAKLQASIQDIEETFEDYDFDYSRKLFLIERCIYGSDIQPIAIQITKLRFFISLLVDQYPKPGKTNQGIRALPNLETNLVAANSLIPMELEQQIDIFFDKLFEKFQDDITIIHNEYFSTRGRADKQRIRKAEIQLRQSFSKELEAIDVPIEKAELIARWNPYASNDFAQFFSPKIMFGFANFDIVIANPPYIRQEDIPNKANLQKSGYKVFNSTSDIYTYFYELAHNLLSESGVACYITSNKWLRSKYGTKLRNLLRNNTCIHTLIDFGGYKVFESATVDTNIILYTKNLPTVNYMLDFVNIPSNMKPELLSQSIYNTRSSLIQNKLKDSGWTLADNAILKLKDKIEAAGKPLKDWDITIYRGVLTGCNEAFIIDTPTKERLCAEDTKSAEVIRPILRGRDISRYQYKWAGLWIIIIESGWTDANRNGADPETFLRSLYPAVYNHFQRHLSNVNDGAMKSRGKGLIDRDDQGDYWWELRDCAYYDEFEKEKIVWADIAQGSCFQYDDEGLYLNNTVYMLTGKKLKLLLSVLNSKVYDFYFRMISSGLSNQASRGFKIFVEQFPIPCLDDDNITKQLDQLATQITSACNEPENTTSTEAKLNVKTLSHKIDQLVYQLFGLTDEEIAIVEGVAEK